MTSTQKLHRIAEIVKVGWRNITANGRREIFQLVGITLSDELPPKRLLQPEIMQRAKAIRKMVAEFYGLNETILWMKNPVNSSSILALKERLKAVTK